MNQPKANKLEHILSAGCPTDGAQQHAYQKMTQGPKTLEK